MTLEVFLELFLADATMLMCHVPHHRWTVINDAFDGEIAHNFADWLRGVNIDLINIRSIEYPLAVLISLLTIKNKLAEVWSDGNYYIHTYSKYFFII